MAWLPTPVFLPGKSHGQRSPEDYSPWGCKESDTTESLTHADSHSFLENLSYKLKLRKEVEGHVAKSRDEEAV